jgi:hypothetical protein
MRDNNRLSIIALINYNMLVCFGTKRDFIWLQSVALFSPFGDILLGFNSSLP